MAGDLDALVALMPFAAEGRIAAQTTQVQAVRAGS